MLASITGCPDAALPWIIDLKGGRSARPWRRASGWTAITIEEARLVLRCAVAELRARALGDYSGEEQNVPTPDVPALFVVVDEAHGVLSSMSGDAACQRDASTIASEGGAVNVYLIVLTQYGALHESAAPSRSAATCPAGCASPSPTWPRAVRPPRLHQTRREPAGEQGRVLLAPRPGRLVGAAPRPAHAAPPLREIAARNGALDPPPLRRFAQEWQETFDTRDERLPGAFRRSQEADVINIDTPEQAAARIETELADVPDVPAPPQPLPPTAPWPPR